MSDLAEQMREVCAQHRRRGFWRGYWVGIGVAVVGGQIIKALLVWTGVF